MKQRRRPAKVKWCFILLLIGSASYGWFNRLDESKLGNLIMQADMCKLETGRYDEIDPYAAGMPFVTKTLEVTDREAIAEIASSTEIVGGANPFSRVAHGCHVYTWLGLYQSGKLIGSISLSGHDDDDDEDSASVRWGIGPKRAAVPFSMKLNNTIVRMLKENPATKTVRKEL